MKRDPSVTKANNKLVLTLIPIYWESDTLRTKHKDSILSLEKVELFVRNESHRKLTVLFCFGFLSSGLKAMKYKLITVLYLCLCASLVVRSDEEEEEEEGEGEGEEESGEEDESAEEVKYIV